MKHSIVIVTYNALEHTVRCIESVLKHTQDFELVVVDNASQDGTGGYLKALMDGGPAVVGADLRGAIRRGDKIIPFKLILNQENENFGPGNNAGARVAEGEAVVFLNSDTVVTPGWLDKMQECLDHRPDIAIVGCMSNSSNGRQMVTGVHSGLHDLDHNAMAWAQKNHRKWTEAGIIYGWCMLVRRAFLDKEPFAFDPIFVNSYEDNDLCLRARLAGWRLFIDQGTYIFHHGQGSFQREFGADFIKRYMKNGYENEDRFFEKWKPAQEQKLVAVYRIANCEKYVHESLARTSEFADEIVVLLARSHDSTEAIARSFPKVKVVEVWTEPEHPFDEQAERNWLLQKAIERGATWVISVDGDEVWEKKFVGMVQRLMRNPNPQIFGYWTNWRTIWDTDADGREMYRSDGIFGGFQNYRFHKVLPGMSINKNDNIYNHHCGSAPAIPSENLQWLNVRVKHLGYDTDDQRRKKHAFYRAADPHPLTKDVGNSDYHHLVDKNVQLKAWAEDNRLSVMTVVRNEEDHIGNMLKNAEAIADEIVVVDNGSTDGTVAQVERFARLSLKPVRLVSKIFTQDENGMLMNYSEAKNFGKSLCTGQWILQMDADELFEPDAITSIFAFLDEDIDGFLFQVCNYLEAPRSRRPEDNKFSISDSVRLYRNKKEIFYSGLIHESLEDCLKARAATGRGNIMMSPVVLHHRGYLKHKDKLREKFDRYERINKKQLAVSGGKDPRPLFNLALHADNEGREADAVRLYKECLAIAPRFWRASQHLAFMNLERAKGHLTAAFAEMPEEYKKGQRSVEVLEFLNKHHFKIQKMGA